MTDRELGSGKWKSGSGGGGGTPHSGEHDPNCSGQHSANGYCVPEPGGGAPRGEVEKTRIGRNHQAVSSLLKDHGMRVIRAAGGAGELGDADRADLSGQFDRDLEAGGFPGKVQDALRDAAGKITEAVATGDRKTGWGIAFETAASLAPDLPSTWRPSRADAGAVEELVAGIPRG